MAKSKRVESTRVDLNWGFPTLHACVCVYMNNFWSGLKSLNLEAHYDVLVPRRVARIWKRGGLFWKSEKSANDLDPNFHCSWISFTRFVRKLRRNFSESSEIQTYFPPKIKWSPKKKKKKRSSPKLRLIFQPKSEIQTFFSAQNQVVSKKKKKTRSSPKLRLIFRPNSEIQTFEGRLFCYGGAIFHKKSASKAPKTCDFAYFTSQWGGLEPPPPPPPGYATAGTS